MYMQISLLLPSRGRASLLNRLFVNIYEKTLHRKNLELILVLDEDDIQSHDVLFEGLNIKKIILPRSSMGTYNSQGLAAASGEIIILINDDMLIQTAGWDEKIRAFDAQFADKIYLAYPNDLFKGKCTFPILSRKACELLVKPFPLEYKGAFIDTHLFDIFERVKKSGFNRTIFLKDVIFEHRHYRSGKAEFDETYKNRNRFGDDQVFIDLIPLRQQGAKTLIETIFGTVSNFKFNKYLTANLYKANLFSLFGNFYRSFFKDKTLTLKWRTYLTAYFFFRTLYNRLVIIKNQNSIGH